MVYIEKVKLKNKFLLYFSRYKLWFIQTTISNGIFFTHKDLLRNLSNELLFRQRQFTELFGGVLHLSYGFQDKISFDDGNAARQEKFSLS